MPPQEESDGERRTILENVLADLRTYSTGLETELKSASARGARLEKILVRTRFEASNLEKALSAEQARVNYMLGRFQQLEAAAAQSFLARIVQRPLKMVRDAGNHLTGGGLRALAKRMFAAPAQYCREDERLGTVARTFLKPVSKLAGDVAGHEVQLLEKGGPESQSRLMPDERTRYSRWVAVYDTIDSADRALIRTHLLSLAYRPLISVILSAAGKSTGVLRNSVDSVFKQLYANWELCLVVENVADPQVEFIFGSAGGYDRRIKLARANSAVGVAGAMNVGLRLATGEFVAFLGAGDILPEHALYEVLCALNREEPIDLLYSDQDQIDLDGQRSDPWFKPGWDPDLLLSQNYLGNLTVYRRRLVEAVGLVRPDCEGAELYDLALRAAAATAPDRVHHLPAILYHRCSESETNRLEGASLALRAIRGTHRAVRDHLDAQGNTKAQLGPASSWPSAVRITWPVPDPPPLVSVIVSTRDHADLLSQCVDGVLHRTDYSNLELLIVDNGSTELAALTLIERLSREDPRVRVLRHPGPFNYSALNNAAARIANGEILLLLNNDVDIIEPDWLRELVSHALRPDVGIAGAKLVYPNETIQHGGVTFGPYGQIIHLHRFARRSDPGYCGQLSVVRTLLAVTGACVAIRRAVFFEVGGFDEVNLQVGCNDIDLCLRLRVKGYRVVWTPFAELFHLESASRGYDDCAEFFQMEVRSARSAGPRPDQARASSARIALYGRNLGRYAEVWGSIP